MESGTHHPLAGILIAVVAVLGLGLFGVDLALLTAILLVWIGSLYLASSRPPDNRPQNDGRSFSREYMGELIEHSATPLLVIENNKIVIANQAAQRVLGKHVIGQDSRMAFRQPEAVKLLGKNRSGFVICELRQPG